MSDTQLLYFHIPSLLQLGVSEEPLKNRQTNVKKAALLSLHWEFVMLENITFNYEQQDCKETFEMDVHIHAKKVDFKNKIH